MFRPRSRTATAVALALLSAQTVTAQALDLQLHELPPTSKHEIRELKYDLKVDLPVTAVAIGLWLGSELAKSSLAPSECRWCGVNSIDTTVRNALRVGNPASADTASTVIGFGLAPLAALGLDAIAAYHDGALSNWPVDALLIAEATAISADVTNVVKFAVGRERPYVHDLSPVNRLTSAEDNLSFYSGHTSFAFALAVSTGTIATMRGYRLAPLIWTVGLGIAATTGYLRVAADKHYFTDVVAGAAAGSFVGFSIPFFFHKPINIGPFKNVKIVPSGGAKGVGAIIGVSAKWD